MVSPALSLLEELNQHVVGWMTFGWRKVVILKSALGYLAELGVNCWALYGNGKGWGVELP